MTNLSSRAIRQMQEIERAEAEQAKAKERPAKKTKKGKR